MLVGSTIVPCHLILFMWLGPLNMQLLVYCAIGTVVVAYSTLLSGRGYDVADATWEPEHHLVNAPA